MRRSWRRQEPCTGVNDIMWVASPDWQKWARALSGLPTIGLVSCRGTVFASQEPPAPGFMRVIEPAAFRMTRRMLLDLKVERKRLLSDVGRQADLPGGVVACDSDQRASMRQAPRLFAVNAVATLGTTFPGETMGYG